MEDCSLVTHWPKDYFLNSEAFILGWLKFSLTFTAVACVYYMHSMIRWQFCAISTNVWKRMWTL